MIRPPHVLVLREFETAKIAENWNAARKELTAGDAAAIESFQIGSRSKLFSIGRRQIKARKFVGTINLGQRAIEVLPKIDGSAAETRQRLVEMLAVSRIVRCNEAPLATQATQAATILDAFLRIYLNHLTKEWRRGRLASYRKQDRNRHCLKGKLLFRDQISTNLLHPERFFTRADEFTHDVPQSRLLKAGLEVCRQRASYHALCRDAMSLLMEFDEVADVRFEPSQLATITTDRRTDRFAPLIALAKRFLLSETPDRVGQDKTFSLMFNMNKVFEAYISTLMQRRVCPPIDLFAKPQVSARHLLLRGSTRKFQLRPDIGIYSRGNLICMVDTKWKRLDRSKPHNGVLSSDMYQMYAYAKEYKCPLVIILYPRHGEFEQHVDSYRLLPGDEHAPRIEVCTVDISQPAIAVAAELRQLLYRFEIGPLCLQASS